MRMIGVELPGVGDLIVPFKIAVIGAGWYGCHIASSLASIGVAVVFEREKLNLHNFTAPVLRPLGGGTMAAIMQRGSVPRGAAAGCSSRSATQMRSATQNRPQHGLKPGSRAPFSRPATSALRSIADGREEPAARRCMRLRRPGAVHTPSAMR